jgi:hypothetical protein
MPLKLSLPIEPDVGPEIASNTSRCNPSHAGTKGGIARNVRFNPSPAWDAIWVATGSPG